mmetsp:Transcript_11508/g.14263  ORF Transcript_11508/g.14263 Transcript_11508/m.14263 type:complete len:329 (-) Transcript_11508:258-1244(-)|eukprot:CAMPEP_0172516232 /NCGR_PEP_ID=MMETSP1066-20121228/274546_1 /TAXON_ID=671091 /ORGANISM="Coscinodiscus wailesii, Strain CCMP2513" /LENGTH=328 /DNA_ID=CAMNT_0013297619 /DNA_START=15 /DNA_END=1001 /DNA_ORIENTATION=+
MTARKVLIYLKKKIYQRSHTDNTPIPNVLSIKKSDNDENSTLGGPVVLQDKEYLSPLKSNLEDLAVKMTQPISNYELPKPEEIMLHKRVHSLTQDGDSYEVILHSHTDNESIPDVLSLKTSESDDSFAISESVVRLYEEPLSVLKSNPQILTVAMMQQISDNGLPKTDQIKFWKRVYSLTRHGDAFEVMLRNVECYRHTLLVIETTKGEILGGYADTSWGMINKKTMKNRNFYGGGLTFLFNISTEERQTDGDVVNIYKWTGANHYCQVCDIDKGELAMGGGGDFGLIVQDNFSHGSSGSCETFGNPPLVDGGLFKVLKMEVYTFLSI